MRASEATRGRLSWLNELRELWSDGRRRGGGWKVTDVQVEDAVTGGEWGTLEEAGVRRE